MSRFRSEISEDDLQKQLKELPAINAQVISLYFVDKKTIREIAMQLQLTVPVIRRHLAKGMYLIKKQTGCKEYEEAYRIVYGRKPVSQEAAKMTV